MRVRGNIEPEQIRIERYYPNPKLAEIRVVENIKDVSEINEDDKVTPIYEYDEYTFLVNYTPNLRAEVEADIANWLATGRSLEVKSNASALCEAKESEPVVE